MTDIDDDGQKKPAGTINMPGLFEALAREMLVAAERGRILSKTKNIRDSGAPLEVLFRREIGTRLPTPFRVVHGYLFDSNSICSPQLDAVIIDGSDSHEIMTTPDGASYVPYTSAHAIVEIKNSARKIDSHIAQIGKSSEAIIAMRSRQVRNGQIPQAGYNEKPISILFVANSTNLNWARVKSAYAKAGQQAPTYTVLLDVGFLIAKRQSLVEFDHLSFVEYRQAGEHFVCEPQHGDEFRTGRLLLWIYFAVVARITVLRLSEKSIGSFLWKVQDDFPLFPKCKLNDMR